MSQFPALKPSARALTQGNSAVQVFQSMSGKETRVITGSAIYGDSLSLTFQNLQEDAAKSIVSHFRTQRGTALSFTLPVEVWAGWVEYQAAITPTQKWRYDGPPSVTGVAPSIMTVSVSLVSLA